MSHKFCSIYFFFKKDSPPPKKKINKRNTVKKKPEKITVRQFHLHLFKVLFLHALFSQKNWVFLKERDGESVNKEKESLTHFGIGMFTKFT